MTETEYRAVNFAARFGPRRVNRVLDHADARHEYESRQCVHGIIGSYFILFGAFMDMSVILLAGVAVFQMARLQQRRMKATGRYYRTNRSMEVIGV